MVINLSEQHSLLSNWVSELRNVEIQGDRMRFRRNLERIAEVAAFEISKQLPWETKEIPTPLGIHESKVLSSATCTSYYLKSWTTYAYRHVELF
jgi:uracil phosphoribosyltransferase